MHVLIMLIRIFFRSFQIFYIVIFSFDLLDLLNARCYWLVELVLSEYKTQSSAKAVCQFVQYPTIFRASLQLYFC